MNVGASSSSTSAAVPHIYDPGVKRRLFAGFRPLSGFGLLRMRSSQNRSISLPESKSLNLKSENFKNFLLEEVLIFCVSVLGLKSFQTSHWTLFFHYLSFLYFFSFCLHSSCSCSSIFFLFHAPHLNQ